LSLKSQPATSTKLVSLSQPIDDWRSGSTTGCEAADSAPPQESSQILNATSISTARNAAVANQLPSNATIDIQAASLEALPEKSPSEDTESSPPIEAQAEPIIAPRADPDPGPLSIRAVSTANCELRIASGLPDDRELPAKLYLNNQRVFATERSRADASDSFLANHAASPRGDPFSFLPDFCRHQILN
jgi:hypothetical protein